MTANERVFPLSMAQTTAERVISLLTTACQKIEVAGSVRRGKVGVHDIDIVIWPKVESVSTGQASLFGDAPTAPMPVSLLDFLTHAGWHEPTSEYPRILKVTPQFRGVPELIPVELYLTEPDGSNMGALMQMRTGDAQFNIILAQRALRLGLRYKAGYGIYRGEERMDDGTEEGVFRALGLRYVSPDCRDGEFNAYEFSQVKP